VLAATNKHLLSHKHYFNCLKTGEDHYEDVTRIQSKDHHIKTIIMTKKVLSCNDDKRYIIKEGIKDGLDGKNTLALGHYKINQT
jgi:hypothetical protein